MPEEFLDAAQVRSSLEEVSREVVAQRVRRAAAAPRKAQAKTSHQTLDVTGTQAPGVNTDENRLHAAGVRFHKAKTVSFLQVIHNRLRGELSKRNDSFLFTFAEHSDCPLRNVQLMVVQSDKLTHTQTTGVEQLENCSIANIPE